jgi:hypothetical protein
VTDILCLFYGFFTALGITLRAEQGSAALSRHPLRGEAAMVIAYLLLLLLPFFLAAGFVELLDRMRNW